MTQRITTYNASGQALAPCVNCVTNGRALWYVAETMHKKRSGSRVMHYCGKCWKERKERMK